MGRLMQYTNIIVALMVAQRALAFLRVLMRALEPTWRAPKNQPNTIGTHAPTLTTERLTLRNLEEEDAESLFRVRSNPNVAKPNGLTPYRDVDKARDFICKNTARLLAGLGVSWGLVLRDTKDTENVGEVVGVCAFEGWNHRAGVAQIGFDLEERHWNKKYMSEAVARIIDYGFEEMGLQTVVAIMRTKNERTRRMVDTLGFEGEVTVLWMWEVWLLEKEKWEAKKNGTLEKRAEGEETEEEVIDIGGSKKDRKKRN